MAAVLVFDIETVPDIAAIRQLGLAPVEASDAETVALAQAERKEKTGSDFLPLPLHRVVCVSCLFRDTHKLHLHSFFDTGQGKSQEAEIIQGFFRSIDKHTPQLVSWNGGGFDLPVLHYRAMMRQVRAPKYWDQGGDDREFRYNNYINRYHSRHLDLMDVLAMYQPRASAAMDVMAKLCGFAGKLGMEGSQVATAWLQGKAHEIRNYCETDVINTYLLYVRYQLFCGKIQDEQMLEEEGFVRAELEKLDTPHLHQYLAAWHQT